MAAVFLLVLALAHLCTAYHNCGDIKDTRLADVDEEWYEGQLKNGGFHVIEQGNWNHMKDKKRWNWKRVFGKGRAASSLQTLCYHWDAHIDTGKVGLPMQCTYTNINYQECRIDFSGSDAHGKLEAGGQLKWLKTDNKSYIAGTTCLYGVKAGYLILTTSEELLDPKIIADLGKFFTSIGFDKGQTSAKKGITALYLNSVTGAECQ